MSYLCRISLLALLLNRDKYRRREDVFGRALAGARPSLGSELGTCLFLLRGSSRLSCLILTLHSLQLITRIAQRDDRERAEEMPRWLPSRSTPRAPSPSVQDQDVPSHMHTASTTTDSVPHQDPLTTLNLNPDIWPSFSPSSSSGSAAATPWTLGLGLSPDLTGGLSPPPRARRASARSLGLRTTATHPLRRVQSLESSASGGAGAGSSSAGSSGAGAGGREQFAWRSKERVEEDTASDQISSPGTFGGERDGRRGESSVSTSSISAPSSTSASVMPRSLLSSEREPSREWSEWGSSPRTTGGGMSLGPPPRSRERMRERREVSGETTGARTFDEKSWEFKVRCFFPFNVHLGQS